MHPVSSTLLPPLVMVSLPSYTALQGSQLTICVQLLQIRHHSLLDLVLPLCHPTLLIRRNRQS